MSRECRDEKPRGTCECTDKAARRCKCLSVTDEAEIIFPEDLSFKQARDSVMEVSTEEAQAVLLEGMEGPQYITIQRADGETLGKGVPLLTLNGELISEGMVVDMINAGVGTDYGSATQYYEADDLLQHELTEEDRKLAAALVAVQLQQQQKQQQLHSQSSSEDSTLPDVSHLDSLTPINSFTLQAVAQSNAPPVYPALQTFKRVSHNVKQEFVNVKSEVDVDVSAESSEDVPQNSGPKRSLPHKKRIPRKLKQQTKKTNMRKDAGKATDEEAEPEPDTEMGTMFTCEICTNKFNSQLKFFIHLKQHYEPMKQEIRIAQATNTNITISTPQVSQTIENTVMEEFSEPEDLMEGIRGVVEETGAHIDDDSESPLSDVHNASPLWSISETSDRMPRDYIKSVATSPGSLSPRGKTNIPLRPKKKKKAQKARRRSTIEYMCPHCDRSFHHKNSLVYHVRAHNGDRPHQCDVCGKSFYAASALKVHKRLHSGDKPYKCEECGRHFRQWGDLKYHSTSIHSDHRQYQCEYCGKDFARKYSLIVHRRIHTGEKNYRCEYCNKTFRASSYLQNHRRIHTGEKPHPCTVCGKPFRVKSDMKRHMQTHSSTKPAPNTRPNNRITVTVNPVKSILEAEDEDSHKSSTQARTIQDLVRDLKLEVGASGVVEIVPPDDNPESILPHSGGQSLEYSVTSENDGTPERDPLEAVVRTTENMQYFFM